MERTIGAFIFPDVWQAWGQEEASRTLKSLREFGINTIATESETYRDDLIELAHSLDMRFIGGIACFSDHGRSHQLLKERPELWPILETGEPRPQMEWYVGVTPTFDDYNSTRLDLIEQIMRQHDLDGMCLDFIRWPMHWELEMRPGASRPLQSSFDPHTVGLFLQFANLELPSHCDAVPKQASWILSEHGAAWTDFRCKVITDFVAQARTRIRTHRRASTYLGMYLIPGTDEHRIALVGQRARDLRNLVDFLAPMVYHAIVHQSPEWVTTVIDDVVSAAPDMALPVIQVDSGEGLEMGADWGPPISVKEWQRVACDTARRQDTLGLIAFTGNSLFRDERGYVLSNCVGDERLI